MRTEKEFLIYLEEIKKIAKEEGYESLDEIYVEHLRERFLGKDVIIGKTDRLILREIKESDLAAFYGFEDANEEAVLHTFLKETKEESLENIKAYIGNMYPMYDYGIWTVQKKDTGEIIGLCGLGQNDVNGEYCIDLGYYICPKCRNLGYASECIEFVLDYVKNYLEFSVVYAIIKEENRISKGILRKFGFEFVNNYEKSQEIISLYRRDMVE